MNKIIGIIGAMPEEINDIVRLLSDKKEIITGMRTYYSGKINDISTVVVFSRWGKVAAAATVSTLISEFHITELIFTGVAGAISPELRIGDIVIGKRFIHHDMDARPIVPQYEIPQLNITYIECQKPQIERVFNAVNDLLTYEHLHKVISSDELKQFGITQPKVTIGDIASGDKFFSDDSAKQKLHESLPDVLCVEMEGAAVAQVCYEFNIPFTIIRTISDSAGNKSHIDFKAFIQNISSRYSVEIIKGFLFQ